MKSFPLSFLGLATGIFFLWSCSGPNEGFSSRNRPDYAIAIHGGAGVILREDMSAEQEASYRKALEEALSIGEGILASGGTALDAVEQTLIYLEDNPLFNAGRGAVLNAEGRVELDASIMDGSNQMAGAVGGVGVVKNPIRAARLVMEQSPHVFLTGKGAEQFAIEQGLDTVPNDYFITPARQASWEKAQKHGTVGCVALDRSGNLAAGTSTGGMQNKKFGRLGDAPVIGAGTYADNGACAVSCTGHGEYFIRYAVAHDLAARLAYGRVSLREAARELVMEKLVEKGGAGGLIAVDRNGNIVMPFNTPGMYRGYARPGERVVAIFGD